MSKKANVDKAEAEKVEAKEPAFQPPSKEQIAQVQSQLNYQNELLSSVRQQRDSLLQQVAEVSAMNSVLSKRLTALLEAIKEKGLSDKFEA